MNDKFLRNYKCEVRAEQNEEHGHFLTGRPIVYGQRTNLGWFDEIIERKKGIGEFYKKFPHGM